ncbi:MAG: hypothetical protein DHS80DRAFT_24385 [Piptocephalis tieghemiana]|nr:MAG: hypothetical protein DHS80DRAFT_24385 [Piptocephalis tieghemiana]
MSQEQDPSRKAGTQAQSQETPTVPATKAKDESESSMVSRMERKRHAYSDDEDDEDGHDRRRRTSFSSVAHDPSTTDPSSSAIVEGDGPGTGEAGDQAASVTAPGPASGDAESAGQRDNYFYADTTASVNTPSYGGEGGSRKRAAVTGRDDRPVKQEASSPFSSPDYPHRSNQHGPSSSGNDDPSRPPFTLRAILSKKESSVVIGRAGQNVTEVRRGSSARVHLDDLIPGVMERVISVVGLPDSISLAYSLIAAKLAAPDDDNTKPADRPKEAEGDAITSDTAATPLEESWDKSASKADPSSSSSVPTASGEESFSSADQATGTTQAPSDDSPASSTSISEDDKAGRVDGSGSTKSVAISLIIPNAHMGSIIGKGGAKIKEIQDASGGRLTASEHMLPGSTERQISVLGEPKAIEVAVRYIAEIVEMNQERAVGNVAYRPVPGRHALSGGASNGHSGSGGGAGGEGGKDKGGGGGGRQQQQQHHHHHSSGPGHSPNLGSSASSHHSHGMGFAGGGSEGGWTYHLSSYAHAGSSSLPTGPLQAAYPSPYAMGPTAGPYGAHPQMAATMGMYGQHMGSPGGAGGAGGYGMPGPQGHGQMNNASGGPGGGYGMPGPQGAGGPNQMMGYGMPGAQAPGGGNSGGASGAAPGTGGGNGGGVNGGGPTTTQQIFIPNELVGAVIGKGGRKINEIRQMSGSHVKIDDPQPGSAERLVHITGSAECNQMALYLLYTRLEAEKMRMAEQQHQQQQQGFGGYGGGR